MIKTYSVLISAALFCISTSAIAKKNIIEYFVVEVISAETVYEPKAQYHFHVKPLGNLSLKTTDPFPERFTTDVVLNKHAVNDGYWMLVKINRANGQVYPVDVTSPQVGFAHSAYFRQVFFDRLEERLQGANTYITGDYRSAQVKVNLSVSDDFSIQSRYNRNGNNLALMVTDYYTNLLITVFSPFFARYTELNFEVKFANDLIVVRPLKHKQSHYFLYQALDESEALPTSIRAMLKERRRATKKASLVE